MAPGKTSKTATRLRPRKKPDLPFSYKLFKSSGPKQTLKSIQLPFHLKTNSKRTAFDLYQELCEVVHKNIISDHRFSYDRKRGFLVEIPQQGCSIKYKRASLEKLKPYLIHKIILLKNETRVSLNQPRRVEDDQTYTWWCAQAIFYGLNVTLLKEDIKVDFQKKMISGDLKVPARLRQLRARLKRQSTDEYGSEDQLTDESISVKSESEDDVVQKPKRSRKKKNSTTQNDDTHVTLHADDEDEDNGESHRDGSEEVPAAGQSHSNRPVSDDNSCGSSSLDEVSSGEDSSDESSSDESSSDGSSSDRGYSDESSSDESSSDGSTSDESSSDESSSDESSSDESTSDESSSDESSSDESSSDESSSDESSSDESTSDESSSDGSSSDESSSSGSPDKEDSSESLSTEESESEDSSSEESLSEIDTPCKRSNTIKYQEPIIGNAIDIDALDLDELEVEGILPGHSPVPTLVGKEHGRKGRDLHSKPRTRRVATSSKLPNATPLRPQTSLPIKPLTLSILDPTSKASTLSRAVPLMMGAVGPGDQRKTFPDFCVSSPTDRGRQLSAESEVSSSRYHTPRSRAGSVSSIPIIDLTADSPIRPVSNSVPDMGNEQEVIDLTSDSILSNLEGEIDRELLSTNGDAISNHDAAHLLPTAQSGRSRRRKTTRNTATAVQASTVNPRGPRRVGSPIPSARVDYVYDKPVSPPPFHPTPPPLVPIHKHRPPVVPRSHAPPSGWRPQPHNGLQDLVTEVKHRLPRMLFHYNEIEFYLECHGYYVPKTLKAYARDNGIPIQDDDDQNLEEDMGFEEDLQAAIALSLKKEEDHNSGARVGPAYATASTRSKGSRDAKKPFTSSVHSTQKKGAAGTIPADSSKRKSEYASSSTVHPSHRPSPRTSPAASSTTHRLLTKPNMSEFNELKERRTVFDDKTGRESEQALQLISGARTTPSVSGHLSQPCQDHTTISHKAFTGHTPVPKSGKARRKYMKLGQRVPASPPSTIGFQGPFPADTARVTRQLKVADDLLVAELSREKKDTTKNTPDPMMKVMVKPPPVPSYSINGVSNAKETAASCTNPFRPASSIDKGGMSQNETMRLFLQSERRRLHPGLQRRPDQRCQGWLDPTSSKFLSSPQHSLRDELSLSSESPSPDSRTIIDETITRIQKRDCMMKNLEHNPQEGPSPNAVTSQDTTLNKYQAPTKPKLSHESVMKKVKEAVGLGASNGSVSRFQSVSPEGSMLKEVTFTKLDKAQSGKMSVLESRSGTGKAPVHYPCSQSAPLSGKRGAILEGHADVRTLGSANSHKPSKRPREATPDSSDRASSLSFEEDPRRKETETSSQKDTHKHAATDQPSKVDSQTASTSYVASSSTAAIRAEESGTPHDHVRSTALTGSTIDRSASSKKRRRSSDIAAATSAEAMQMTSQSVEAEQPTNKPKISKKQELSKKQENAKKKPKKKSEREPASQPAKMSETKAKKASKAPDLMLINSSKAEGLDVVSHASELDTRTTHQAEALFPSTSRQDQTMEQTSKASKKRKRQAEESLAEVDKETPGLSAILNDEQGPAKKKKHQSRRKSPDTDQKPATSQKITPVAEPKIKVEDQDSISDPHDEAWIKEHQAIVGARSGRRGRRQRYRARKRAANLAQELTELEQAGKKHSREWHKVKEKKKALEAKVELLLAVQLASDVGRR